MNKLSIVLKPVDTTQPDSLNASYWSDGICSRCNTAIFSTQYRKGFYLYDETYINAFIFEFCPNCNQVSIREYYHVSPPIIKSSDPGMVFSLDLSREIQRRFPIHTKLRSFPENISNFSPDFIKIYNQTEIAENMGLSEICGPGYRKALEFLIKDYKMYIAKDDAAKDKVIETTLGKHAKEMQDEDTTLIASTAVSLGNSYTHYINEYENCPISELKEFIIETANRINSHIIEKKAENLKKQD